MTKKILVISDLHCGSESAIMPHSYAVNDHTEDRSYTITANKTQSILYDKWIQMIDDVGKVDGLFILGDCVDGVNIKGLTSGISNADLNWQQEMAIDLIKMIDVKYDNYYAVQGSAYHTGNNGGQDYGIAKALTREAHSKFIFGDDIVENIDGINIHARHVTSYSKIPELRKNALKRDITEFLNEGKRLGKIHLALRGHVHYYEYLNWKPYLYGVTCPCWKGRDSFIAQKSVSSPDCGYITINIDNGDFEVIPEIFKVN